MCFLSVHSQQITSRKKILYIPPCHKQLGLIFRFKENSKTAIAPVAVKFWTANLKSPQRGTNNCEMYHQAAGTADFAAFAGDRSPEPADSVVSLAANVTCHGADRGKTKKTPQLDNYSASCFNASLNLQTYIYISHTHTLAQNGHCELWSGMHLTCKKQLSRLKRLERVSEKIFMLVPTEGWLKIANWSKNRLRQPYRKRSK